MVQIAMLLFAYPLGAARWSRSTAYAATAAMFVVVSVPQWMTTVPERSTISYWVVQAITAVVAYALVTVGSARATRRRAQHAAV